MSDHAIQRRHGPDYIDRTIATVRNHRDADNCWPQWANIFADEIEILRRERDERVSREFAVALANANAKQTERVRELEETLVEISICLQRGRYSEAFDRIREALREDDHGGSE